MPFIRLSNNEAVNLADVRRIYIKSTEDQGLTKPNSYVVYLVAQYANGTDQRLWKTGECTQEGQETAKDAATPFFDALWVAISSGESFEIAEVMGSTNAPTGAQEARTEPKEGIPVTEPSFDGVPVAASDTDTTDGRGYTKDALLKIAADRGITVPAGAKKADVVALLDQSAPSVEEKSVNEATS